MNKKIIAFVPARGGSSRIPKKNLQKIGGIPLFLRACYNLARVISKENIVVDSDSEEILSIAAENGFQQLSRPSHLATNDTDGNAFFRWETSNYPDADIYIQHLPPMPFLSKSTIEEALHLICSRGFDSIVAVGREKFYLWDPEESRPKYNLDSIPNSFTLEETVYESMGFYVIHRDAHFKTGRRIGEDYAFLNLPKIEQLDIDYPEDLELACAVESGLAFDSPYKSINLLLGAKKEILKNCRAIFCDVDGVLTDGKMVYSEGGDELKNFHTRDGIGARMLKKAGYKLAMISSGINEQLIHKRGSFLGFHAISSGMEPKKNRITALTSELGIEPGEILYLGDDINDLDFMNECGFTVCPQDAHYKVKAAADLILEKKGGEGCLRELADYLLEGVLK